MPGANIDTKKKRFKNRKWRYTMVFKNDHMKKVLNPYYKDYFHASIDEYAFIKEDVAVKDTESHLHVNRGLPDILSFKFITTTPLTGKSIDLRINRILKRGFDIFFATIVIFCLLSWLIAIIAILIKLDSKGSVFFLQKRNKKHGEVFTCIKFRSMIINDEADLKPAEENDERITGIGKFLRKNYVDELPQFFNVLWGDMSLIGPRPHMISDNMLYEELVQHYSLRHKVKPGITGLAQVMGYVGSTDDIQKMQERITMDIFYVRHWSFKLDMVILYRTIRKTLG